MDPGPPLLLVTGPPGAGKSTVARLLAEHGLVEHGLARPAAGPTVLVEGDAFFGFLAANAIPPWEPASQAQNGVVVDASATATARFVAAGWATIFDGVIGPWFVDRFLATAGLARADYVILLPSEECCVDRVATRTGHGFTDEAATRKMHHEFRQASIEDRHVLDSGDLSAEEAARWILAARAEGRLRYRRLSTESR